LIALTISGQDTRNIPKPVELSTERQLFIDDQLVESRFNVTRVMHEPVRLPAPILLGDKPWEGWTIDTHGSPNVMFDKEEQLYKMWYHVPDVVR
jgi:hypothetical protein